MDEIKIKTEAPPADVEFAGPEQFAAHHAKRYCNRLIEGFGWIRIQNLSELELGQWETDDIGEDGKRTADGMKETRAYLICKCLVNGKGERRFNDKNVGVVMAADSAMVAAAFEYCRAWCGIPKRDVDAVAALRAIQKNLETGPG